MAKPRSTPGPVQVHIEYLFDRLHDSKLAQAYILLVPIRERPVGGNVKEFVREDGGDGLKEAKFALGANQRDGSRSRRLRSPIGTSRRPMEC